MEATLRVDPARLVLAAEEQLRVGQYVAGMASGQSMTAAVTGMPGLASGAACAIAGALLDGAAGVISGALSTHSASLCTAADHYRRADAELGRRIAEPAQ